MEAEHTAAREGVALFDLSSFGNYNDSTLTLVSLKSGSAKPPVMPLPHIEQLRVPSAARTRPYPLVSSSASISLLLCACCCLLTGAPTLSQHTGAAARRDVAIAGKLHISGAGAEAAMEWCASSEVGNAASGKVLYTQVSHTETHAWQHGTE